MSNGLCPCKDCNEKICKWCGDTLHELTAKEVCQEYIDTLESQLTKAREEIVWWKEKAKGSLDMANQAITERDILKAKLSKLERVRVAAEKVQDYYHGKMETIGALSGLDEALAALRETEEK